MTVVKYQFYHMFIVINTIRVKMTGVQYFGPSCIAAQTDAVKIMTNR